MTNTQAKTNTNQRNISIKGGNTSANTKKTKPVVKYHKNKKSGIRYKRTLLLTLKGQIAEKMSKCDLSLYWLYDAKRKKLEIYEDKMI